MSMNKYYYKKVKTANFKKRLRLVSLVLFTLGIAIVFYIFFPLISWQIYFAKSFASQNITTPIPKINIVSASLLESLLSQAGSTITGVDYTNAQNWFPNYKVQKDGQEGKSNLSSYALSIPKLNIQDAQVTTIDNDLSKHLVNYEGTGIPPDNGNAVIFGHSTLPQLFNPKDYKTIFATLYRLSINDVIEINVSNAIYSYRVYSIIVVDPDNTSIFSQSYDNSYITLVTCTPPGTTWKRLIVKARLEKI